MLFIYSNFEHSEALDALLPLEASLTGELKAAYQRVSGKLKGRFRQKFYIKEFQDSLRNQKRMKHAAEMMIKEPHPDYVPFLNEEIQKDVRAYREKGLPVLAKLGDETSLDAIFLLLPKLLVEKEKITTLIKFLTSKENSKIKKLQGYLEALARIGNWEEGAVTGLVQKVLNDDLVEVLELIRSSFNINSNIFWEDVERFISSVLKGEPITELSVTRLRQSFDTWHSGQCELLEQLFLSLGEIGHRCKVPELLQKAEAYLDEDEPAREDCMAAFLGGYRSDDALEKLLALLETGKTPRFLEKVLEALGHYQIDEAPARVVSLARDSEEKSVRCKAMDLLAKWGLNEDMIENLLSSESIAVRADCIRLIAEHQIQPGYQKLLQLLGQNIPASLTEIVISALSEFPGDETGEALTPYLFPPHPYPIRSAALEGLFTSGGDNRFHTLCNQLKEYPKNKQSEILNALLKLLDPERPLEPPPGLLGETEFWKEVLNDEKQEKMRLQAAVILENADWRGCIDYDGWIKILNDGLTELDKIRTYDEKRKIRLLIHKIRNQKEKEEKKLEKSDEPKGAIKIANIKELLKKLQAPVHYERVRAIRQVNLIFKPEMLKEQEDLKDQMAGAVAKFMDDNEGAPEMMKVAITLSGKLPHPDLKARLKHLCENHDQEVAEYAKKVLDELGGGEPGGKPIEKIFLMDDSLVFTKALQRFLTRAGFEVCMANQPDMGLQNLGENPADLLIVDFNMPAIDGPTFLSKARSENIAPSHTIFVTSSRDKDDIQKIITMGVSGLLLKPFPIESLIDKIKSLA